MFEPHWDLTPLMQRQIKAIDSTAGFLDAVRLQPEKSTQLHRRIRVQDALSSIQIEGGQLSFERAFELSSLQDEGGGNPLNEKNGEGSPFLSEDEREFLNYLRAFEQIEGVRGRGAGYRVSPRDLLNIHHTVVNGVRGGDRFAGRFRSEEIKVGDMVGGATVVHHQPPPWTLVEEQARELCNWINASMQKLPREQVLRGVGSERDAWVHGAVVAGVAQHRLVWIHPFVDGNGRTARLFTALLLLLRGYDFKYLFDLSSYYNRDRDAYYDALRTADRTADYTPWLEYFLGGFSHQMMTVRAHAHEVAAGLSPAS
jgi:Fic family protein